MKHIRLPSDETCRVPHAAKWLGAAGVIPFVTIAISGPFLSDPLKYSTFLALIAYGAVILSFLGGIHWGLSITPSREERPDGASFQGLGVSVLPALIGWVALLVAPSVGIFILAIAFGLVLIVDLAASRKGEAPAWYPSLRWPLTVTVIAALLTGGLA
jgi:hypothetical protein